MKLLAVASIGGHWVQLLRLQPLFEKHETIFLSTHDELQTMVENKLYTLPDFNRNNIKGVFKAIIKVIRVLRLEKPSCVITTGAAPGLLTLFLAKIYGSETIWLDSIANVEKLSMSGKIASKFCSRVYTQWSHLATSKINYAGNILS